MAPVPQARAAAKSRLLIIGARTIDGGEGGVEKFAEEFSRRLSGSCRITVLCLREGKPADLGDVDLVVAPRSNLLSTDKIFYYMLGACMCLTGRFEHVVLLGINSGMMLVPVRLMFWRRASVMVRSGSIDYMLPKWGLLPKLYFRLAERLLRSADLVVAVAPNIQRHLALRGIRSIVIPNGLRRSAAAGAEDRRQAGKVVAVGRVTAQKNYGQLIRAAPLLRGREITIDIVGGADLSRERMRLEALRREAGATNVGFVGVLPRHEVMERIATAALFVNCSIHEGMSNSVLEAIEQRTPVILSDIEANRDFGLPDAFYFDPHSPQDLAAHIEAALADSAAFTVDTARFHDWDSVIETYRTAMRLPAAPVALPEGQPPPVPTPLAIER